MVAEEMNDNEVKEEEDKGKKKKVTEEEMKMAKDHGAEALKVVAKLHRQLGHPHNDKLVAALRDAKIHEMIIECART
jgi:flagellar motor switch protein FliM